MAGKPEVELGHAIVGGESNLVIVVACTSSQKSRGCASGEFDLTMATVFVAVAAFVGTLLMEQPVVRAHAAPQQPVMSLTFMIILKTE